MRFIEDQNPDAPAAPTLYARVRPLLTADAREFWDANAATIRHGILQAGRYETYLGIFRRLLRWVVGPRTLRDLMRLPQDEQADFYRTRWDRRAWRLFFRLFFSRRVLGMRGLDPQFFQYVEGVPSFGEHWRRLAEHVLTDLPVRENYFVAQIAFGRYLNRQAVPHYLHPRHFASLKRYAARVRIVTDEGGVAELSQFAARHFAPTATRIELQISAPVPLGAHRLPRALAHSAEDSSSAISLGTRSPARCTGRRPPTQAPART